MARYNYEAHPLIDPRIDFVLSVGPQLKQELRILVATWSHLPPAAAFVS